MQQETLMEKIQSLPPEKIAEVEDFVDFLRHRDEDRLVRMAGMQMSEAAFARVWDNEDDARYDAL